MGTAQLSMGPCTRFVVLPSGLKTLTVSQDTVDVAGIKAKAQYFSPVTTLSSSFENDPIDGILGLAFPAISNLNQSPFFNTANKDGTVKSNQFGFFLASND